MVFELINVDVSFVNALRRILLTEASIHSLNEHDISAFASQSTAGGEILLSGFKELRNNVL